MIHLHVCPSTLTKGFDSYCNNALNLLFDGINVSPFLNILSPSSEKTEGELL